MVKHTVNFADLLEMVALVNPISKSAVFHFHPKD
jgi:uncharacterized membrane protein